MELIILIFIIYKIVKAVQKSKENTTSQDSTIHKSQPSIPAPPKPQAPSAASVQQKVNQHLYGSASKPQDKYSRYRRFIEQDRYTDLKKLAHELDITKYQAAREIKDLQEQGYFKTVTVDEKNYKLIYSTPAKYAARTTDTQTAASAQEQQRTYIQKSTPYRPERNAALRHESWMQLPPNTHAVTCHYCGAQNAVPNYHRIKYTCYFCREEL